MKRPIAIVGQHRGATTIEPVALRVGQTDLRIADTGDGQSAAVFADMLVASGAERIPDDGSSQSSVYIVVRAPTSANPSNEREEKQSEADIILGSARPAFARLLMEELRSG